MPATVHGPQLAHHVAVAAHDHPGGRSARAALDERVAAHRAGSELLDDTSGVVDGDGGVGVAVEGDHRHRPGERARPRGTAHGRIGGREVLRAAVRQPRVHAHRREHVRVRRPQHRGHRRAGGETGDVHAVAVDLVLAGDLVDDPDQDGRLAAAAVLVTGLEPVPEPHRVGGGDLLGVDDEHTVLLGELAHPGGGGEVGGGLRAAVQHHDERARTRTGGGDVQGVRPGAGRAPMDALPRLSGERLSGERRNRRPGPGGARSGGRAEEVAQVPEAVPARDRRAREMLEGGRREVGSHAVGGLGEPLAQPIPQSPAAAPGTRRVRVAARVEQVPLRAGRASRAGARRVLLTGRCVPVRWSSLRRPVVAEAFLVDHDLARHHADRTVTGQGPLDQRRRFGQPAGTGQGGRLRHGGQVLTVHGRSPSDVGIQTVWERTVFRIPSVHHPPGWCTTRCPSRYPM